LYLGTNTQKLSQGVLSGNVNFKAKKLNVVNDYYSVKMYSGYLESDFSFLLQDVGKEV